MPVPLGDVVDRVTILDLKVARIADPARVAHARAEREALLGAWIAGGLPPLDELATTAELAEVNGRLWEVEDALREHEARGEFGPDFVELARSVYRLNDRRAALKHAINVDLGSSLVEVKSYAGGEG